ncbi:MAG: hypothetical protein AAGE59_36735, partial [Cyanobacteria bacterium P01_F01_bin.86]
VTDINFGNRQLPTSSATNFSFETGDFSGWQVQGDGTLQTSSIGVAPTDGTYQALMTTDATAGAITAGNLETFLGLEDNALSLLGNGIAIEGSALQLDAFTVEAGAVLTFDWNFLTGDDTPDLTANDFGFVSLSNGFGTELADTFGDFTSFTGSTFDQHTGYGTYHYTFATAGTYTLGIGVVDANSSAGTSGLLVDNIELISFSQTESILNLGSETDDATGGENTGEDLLLGSNSQNDILYGGSGNDTLAGKQGDDTLYGEAGDDVLRGDDNSSAAGGITGGNDVLYGGAGHDRLGGKAGDDVLYGESGDDQMWGDDGDDILWGGAGNNTLMGDDFSGGSGHDTFVLTAEAGVDTILDFEIGVDVIGLAGDLTFEALTFAGNTIRHDEAVLAVLDGVDTQTLTTDSFTHV